jgi:hypothetical protein
MPSSRTAAAWCYGPASSVILAQHRAAHNRAGSSSAFPDANHPAIWLSPAAARAAKGEAVKLFFFHLMPFADRRRNLEVFARKVIPRVRHLGERAPAGAAE